MEKNLGLVDRLSTISSLCRDPVTGKVRDGNVQNPTVFRAVEISRSEILFALGVEGVKHDSDMGRAIAFITAAPKRTQTYRAIAFGASFLRKELGETRRELYAELGDEVRNPNLPVEEVRWLLNQRYDHWCSHVSAQCRNMVSSLESLGGEYEFPSFGLSPESATSALKEVHQQLLAIARELPGLVDEAAAAAALTGRGRLTASIGERQRRTA